VQGLAGRERYLARDYSHKIDDLPVGDLLVNCTPQPLEKIVAKAELPQTARIFEMRYAGTKAGRKDYLDGSYMLAVQAAHNFKLMTGLEVSAARILRICKEGR
jgi:shikimate 5-dehydrogenase